MAIFLFGLSQQDLQLRFLEYGGLGGPWRLVSLSAYGDPENPEYAAIWHHDPGHPTQALALRVKAGELGVIEEMWNTYGMLPTVVTAVYGPAAPGSDYDIEGSNVRWNFVFEKSPQLYSDMQFFHWVPYDTLYQAQRAGPPEGFQGSVFGGSSSAPDRDIVSFDVIRTESGTVAYTGLLYPKTTPPVGTGLNTVNVTNPPGNATWENHSDTRALRSGWARPELAVPHPAGVGGERTVVTQWRDDVLGPWPSNMVDGSFTGGAVVVGPIGLWNIQGAHDDMTAKGYLPYRIAVSGSWSEARACIVYARSTVVLERKFVVVDARDPSPPLRIGGKIKGAAKHRLFDALAPNQQGSWHTKSELRGLGGIGAFGQPRQSLLASRSNPSVGARSSARSFEGLLSAVRSVGGFDEVYPVGGSTDGGLFGGSAGASASSAQGQNLPFNRYKKIDDWVRAHLESSGGRAAQVAIARGGKLVVSRAYTLAEHNCPVIWPTHLLGVGSISKALTGIAAAHHFFPNGEVSGLETPLAQALGLLDCVNPQVQQKLGSQPLHWLLMHRSGWPRDFGEAEVAGVARGWSQPPIPGDLLRFVRNTPADFVAPLQADGTYPAEYAGSTLRALGERVSELFSTEFELPVSSEEYETRMRSWWEVGEKARARGRTPLDCWNAGIFPSHAAVIELADNYVHNPNNANAPGLLRLPSTYSGTFDFSLAPGTWCMSAATCARILSGMDPTSGVKRLLGSGAVQSMLDGDQTGYGSALFVHKRNVTRTLLLHNGGAPGVNAVGGVDFPGSSATLPSGETTCVVFIENIDDPHGAATEGDIYALQNRAITIENLYGWEADDLYALA
jgi:hypothetical protein